MIAPRPGTQWHRVIAALVFAVIALHRTTADAAGLVDPFLRFHSLPTPHFVIHFHEGEDALAARLAAIAEVVWDSTNRSPFGPPPATTHVLLVDQTEAANGFATPFPRNVIFLSPVWPGGSEFIGNTDDWLRLVFVHEFTHIVHLDRSAGWARAVRAVFGRTPLAFPNIFLPQWQIEGLATYEESAAAGPGRAHAGDFGAIVQEAGRAGRPEPLDRVNGGLIDWPDGHAPYAYGAGFHAFLAGTYGAERLAALARATAGRVPYTASRVFKPVFGKSLGELWRDYQLSIIESTRATAIPDGATRLTHHGSVVRGPRFASGSEIVYSIRTPDAFPTLNAIALDGSPPRTLTTRFSGSTVAISPDTIYFDQLEYRRNVAAYADLYAYDRRAGTVRALSLEARLLAPDVSPDGTRLVCARNGPQGRDLVLADLGRDAAGRPVLAGGADGLLAVTMLRRENETQFDAPRWSPDGRTIAAERHTRGGLSEIVLIDARNTETRVLASRAGTRYVTPAWRPDGRAIVAAGAAADEPFNLYEFPIDGSDPRQLTHRTGGATWPDVSPDGRTLVFVGYTADGQDLFTTPYPEPEPGRAAEPPLAPHSAAGRGSPAAADRDADTGPVLLGQSAPYRPWSTLTPTSWSPIIESDSNRTRIGAGLSGADVLSYHAYAAGVSWLASRPSAAIGPPRRRPDWFAYYVYSRWRPVFWLSASNRTSFFAGHPTDEGAPSRATAHEQAIEAGVAFPVRHARASHTTSAMFHRGVDEFTESAGIPRRNRTALRAAWNGTTARTFGYSISPEDGFAAGVTTELVRRAFGAADDATTVSVDTRAYLPGRGRHHVAALRLAAGRSTGDSRMGRTFLLGGPGPNTARDGFGREAISVLRGFPASRFAGTRVVLVNAEYRLPLARVERGIGTWPLFLQTLHASLFVDAGHAWTGRFRASHIKTSAGAELSAGMVAGYVAPLTVTIGAALGHDGAGTSTGAVAYVRIGRAF